MDHLSKLFTPFAEEHNLTFVPFGSNANQLLNHHNAGTIQLSDAFGNQLDPAPITPTDTAAYRLLSGSIRATHAKTRIPNPRGQNMIVVPYLDHGNTGECPIAVFFN